MKTVARLIFASSLALKAVGVRAELPPSIEEALFGLTEGNVAYGRNYREWLKSDGTVVFAKNFGFFDKGVFRAFTDNSKDIHFLYNIEPSSPIPYNAFHPDLYKGNHASVFQVPSTHLCFLHLHKECALHLQKALRFP